MHGFNASYIIYKMISDLIDNNSIREDIYAGLTLVDLNKEGHKDDIFIMAMQAKQVFYISIDSQWSVALFTQPWNHYNDDDYDGAMIQLLNIIPLSES